jgi:hypothetical protein
MDGVTGAYLKKTLAYIRKVGIAHPTYMLQEAAITKLR